MTSAPTCLLLPGMLCSPVLWHGQRELERVATVVHLPLARATVQGLVDDVLALPYDRMTLVGLSLGGIVAMGVAAQAPERVSGLALLSTNARAPRDDQFESWDAMATRTRAGCFDEVVEQLADAMLHPSHRLDPQLRHLIRQMALDTGPERFLVQLAAQHTRVDLRAHLPRTRCPTLVVSAAQDRMCPPSTHEEIAALVPGARYEVVRGSGHLSTLEQPDTVRRLLVSWVRARSGAEPTVGED